MNTIVISGELKEANKLALLVSLSENDLKYTLFDAIESNVNNILNSIRANRTKQRAAVIKNVSRETDLFELLKLLNNKVPVIIACNVEVHEDFYRHDNINFQLITIKNIA